MNGTRFSLSNHEKSVGDFETSTKRRKAHQTSFHDIAARRDAGLSVAATGTAGSLPDLK